MSNTIHPELWVANYGDYLFSLACMKVNDKETAKDLVSETFLSALKASDGFRSESSEKTWLASILKNKIIDHYRKTKNTFSSISEYLNETEQQFYEGFFEPTSTSDAHWKKESYPTSNDSFTDQVIRSSEFTSILQYCLSKIPDKMKLIFIARFIDDENSDDICKEYEISSSNYWVLIHRAKLVMRACLEKNWIQE